MLFQLLVKDCNGWVLVEAHAVERHHNLLFCVASLSLELIRCHNRESQVQFNNLLWIYSEQFEAIGDHLGVELVVLLVLAESLVHVFQLFRVLDLIRVIRVPNVHAVQVLIQTTDHKISLPNILHESLMAIEEELLTPFDLLVHQGEEFDSLRLLQLESLLDLIFVEHLVFTDRFESRSRLVSRMICHSGVFQDQSEQAEVRGEMGPTILRILA